MKIDEIYEQMKEEAYELYKRDWCKARGYDYEEVLEADFNDEEYNGEMYASLGEFEDMEFTDAEYMRYLMGAKYDEYMKAYKGAE